MLYEVITDVNGNVRFRLLETVRQFGREELDREGEDGRLLDANGEAARALGYEREELIGLSIREIAASGRAEHGRRCLCRCRL